MNYGWHHSSSWGPGLNKEKKELGGLKQHAQLSDWIQCSQPPPLPATTPSLPGETRSAPSFLKLLFSAIL